MQLAIIGLLALAFGFVEPHGYLMVPLARTSIQLEYGTQNPPYWWDNKGVWCNNAQQNLQYSTCGRCGEAQGNGDASQGGLYYKGIITANWTSGAIVEMKAGLDNAHFGHFKLEICASETESNNCFQPLKIVSASQRLRDDETICIPFDNPSPPNDVVTARVQLPSGVRCNRCTIRWTYRTSYPAWGAGQDDCYNPNPAQTFRNCADVRIQ